jgi:hypothetical protein
VLNPDAPGCIIFLSQMPLSHHKSLIDGMLGEVVIGFLDRNLNQSSHDELG